MSRMTGAAMLAAVCGLVLAALPRPAAAQNALGDGRALDRSLQTGAGRVNTRVRDIEAEIQFQNALVTGNAPGGRSFRGNVGYLAPGEFRGSLGSNDIFEFQRDTALAAASAGAGLRSPDALRYQFGLTSGPAVPTEYWGPLAFERSGAGASGAQVASGLRSTADFLTRRALQPVVVGGGQTRGGQDVAITASPLLGLRHVEYPVKVDGAAPPDAVAPQPQDGLGVPAPAGSTPSIEQRRPEELPGVRVQPPGDPRVAAPPAQRPAWAFTGYEPVVPGVRRQTQPRPDQVQAGVDRAAPSLALEQRSPTYREVADRVREQFALAREEEAARRADLPPLHVEVEQRLAELRRQLAGEREDEPARREIPGLEDPSQRDRQRPGDPAAADRPERSEARRREILRETGILDADRLGMDPQLVEAIRRSRITVDNLATVSPTDNLVYAENMAVGQELLGQERYFDAEERFVRAAAAVPGDVMAQIGRAHAQIGAGLYMSAAMNLRTILTVRPELAATRYGAQLLPPAPRWRTIAEQLRERIAGDEPAAGRAAALVLAYLGYQMGDPASIREGLQAMRQAPDFDLASEQAFVGLLEAIWLAPGPAPTK